ncbi:hypothetical protein JRQ81_016841 [Phrynocephalus forsythii]|uniref:Cation/H+ exchanger transmembrane domain-containing protein n=1 Tax=Phrynocephalus forsythii TaxID=171643 RepID=A0A9Q1B1P6_9SAUR|nr:hypothetical protein JRQ81_016841 [Phrynocephalus forsythii]
MAEDKLAENESTAPAANMTSDGILLCQDTQEASVLDSKAADSNLQTEETALLNSYRQQPQESQTETMALGKIKEICACPPRGILAQMITCASDSLSSKEVEKIIAVAWDIFQPFLFGLIGAEISVASLSPETVGLCVATLFIGLTARITATFLLVCFAGFNIKEKIFISLAWIPKATVQAAIGSVALDAARAQQDETLEKYGMDVLTVAFLAILITAPIGALIIGLAGPRLLHQAASAKNQEEHGAGTQEEMATRGAA